MRQNLRWLLAKNASTQMAVGIISLLIGFVTATVLSRYLGVEGFGQFSYMFAFFYFFMALNDFGVNVIVVREISKNREQAGEIIGSVLIFKLGLAILSVLVAWVMIGFMDFPAEFASALRIFALYMPVTALQLPSVIYQVTLKLSRGAIITLLAKGVAGFLIIMGVVWLGYGLQALAAAYVLTEVVLLAAVLKDTRRFVRPVLHFDLKLWKRILGPSFIIGITGLFGAVINQTDFMMLERLTDMHQVGLYAVAHKVTNQLESLPLMVMSTLYPLMSHYVSADPSRLRVLYRKSVLALSAAGILIGIIVTIFSPLIVRLLFGIQFQGAERGLAVLVWSTVLVFMAITGGNLLISLGKERLSLFIIFLGAGLNIALNAAWIPRWGFVGGAWATVATYSLIFLGVWAASSRALQQPNPDS